MAVGRKFDEILRVIVALQLSENYDVVTPANWQNGEKAIISRTLSSEEINSKFADDYEEVKPYMRFTQQPGSE